MIISKKPSDHLIEPDTDILLLKKVNGIISILKDNEFANNPALIHSGLCKARTTFLNAWLNEAKENLYSSLEKNEARLELNAQVEQFEDFIQGETSELIQAYMILQSN